MDLSKIIGISVAGKAVESIDIGGVRVWQVKVPEAVTYSVTNALTNCTSSNAATSVSEGDAYTATISWARGYEVYSASVMMGGENITLNVWSVTGSRSGAVFIGSVTGDVVITIDVGAS